MPTATRGAHGLPVARANATAGAAAPTAKSPQPAGSANWPGSTPRPSRTRKTTPSTRSDWIATSQGCGIASAAARTLRERARARPPMRIGGNTPRPIVGGRPVVATNTPSAERAVMSANHPVSTAPAPIASPRAWAPPCRRTARTREAMRMRSAPKTMGQTNEGTSGAMRSSWAVPALYIQLCGRRGRPSPFTALRSRAPARRSRAPRPRGASPASAPPTTKERRARGAPARRAPWVERGRGGSTCAWSQREACSSRLERRCWPIARLPRRRDVLVPPEQVARVILGLQLREPLVVGPVCALAHALGLVLGHKVDVHAAGGVWRHPVEEVSRPADTGLVLGGFAPARVDVHHEVHVAVGIRGRGRRHPVDGAAEARDEDLALGRRQPADGRNHQIDRCTLSSTKSWD